MERIALIAAEERVRHEIARTLHDDVQSELLRAAVRLSTVGKNLPPAEQEVVRVALAEIEHAREQGVRSAGRRLAPALAALGLLAALRELCLTYAGVLDVEIESEEHFRERFLRTDDEDPVAIAVYRAVEQGLQNAVQHGRARTGFLRLSVVPPGLVQLQLLTDGALLDANWRPGLGSTVISAWTEAVGGAWTLVPGDEAGAVLTATFGRPPS